MRKVIFFFLILAVGALLTASAHAQTRGLYIIQNATDTLVSVLDGTATGEIAIEEGASITGLEVVWRDAVDNPFQPTGSGDSLAVSVSSPADVSESSTGQWTFEMTSTGEHGVFTATFSLYLAGALDYTSPAIEVHVEEPHAEPEGLRLVAAGDTLVWVDGLTVTGEVEVAHLEETDTITVWFIDAEDNLFQPDDPAEFHMVGTITDPLTADFVHFDSANWTFTITGVEEGMTDLTIGIFHDDHVDYTSPAIEVHVEEPHAEPEGLRLVAAGDTLVWVDGLTVTGEVEVAHLEETDTITVWFIDAEDNLFQPDDPAEFHMVGTITDPLTADFVHFDSANWTFTITGVEEGMTDLTIGIFHDDHVDYTSPTLTVSVSATCCIGDRGDVNGDGVNADPIDLANLVDYLFAGGVAPACDEEADLDGNGSGATPIDLAYLVDFLFTGGIAPVACP